MNSQLMIKIATLLYVLSLVTARTPMGWRHLMWFFLCTALVANAAAVLYRYQQAWPMLPMYLGPAAIPLCLGCLLLILRQREGKGSSVVRIILVLMVTVAVSTVLFPKDYYLPFVKSGTLWAHFFFLFGVLGKGCFLVGAAYAMAALSRGRHRTSASFQAKYRQVMRWTVWGFAFWTLSMFTGEIWSYRGWGTPVVWEDPAITTTMATWFFYICLLHLHLTGSWTVRSRGVFAAAGAGVIFVLNCIPELGPFRWPL